MLPALFVSHGSPTLPFDECPARDFLRALGGQIACPKAILAISAHWDTPSVCLTAPRQNETIHDFYGFPEKLYGVQYTPPPDPGLAGHACRLLADAGIRADLNENRGLDHGAWVPLMLMYPGAGIPVVQLAVQSHAGPAHHIAVGRALASLRKEDVLILASGGFVHNLRELAAPDTPEPAWVTEFSDWMAARLAARDEAALCDYRKRAPWAERAHPSAEHLMPLFVAYGAGGTAVARLHASTTFGTLRMDAFSFL